VHKPQEGRRALRSASGSLRSILRRAGEQRDGSPSGSTKPTGGGHRDERGRRREANPWRGKSPGKARARRRLRRRATDFRGGQSPEGERGDRLLYAAAPFEPTPGGPGRSRDRFMPRKGKSSEGESQERYRLKHGGKDSEGTRRQEGGKPWRRSITGRGKPGSVAFHFRKRCREQNPGEARRPRGRSQIGSGHTPKGSESSRGVRGISKSKPRRQIPEVLGRTLCSGPGGRA